MKNNLLYAPSPFQLPKQTATSDYLKLLPGPCQMLSVGSECQPRSCYESHQTYLRFENNKQAVICFCEDNT